MAYVLYSGTVFLRCELQNLALIYCAEIAVSDGCNAGEGGGRRTAQGDW
jgi:hypothetical protein